MERKTVLFLTLPTENWCDKNEDDCLSSVYRPRNSTDELPTALAAFASPRDTRTTAREMKLRKIGLLFCVRSLRNSCLFSSLLFIFNLAVVRLSLLGERLVFCENLLSCTATRSSSTLALEQQKTAINSLLAPPRTVPRERVFCRKEFKTKSRRRFQMEN